MNTYMEAIMATEDEAQREAQRLLMAEALAAIAQALESHFAYYTTRRRIAHDIREGYSPGACRPLQELSRNLAVPGAEDARDQSAKVARAVLERLAHLADADPVVLVVSRADLRRVLDAADELANDHANDDSVRVRAIGEEIGAAADRIAAAMPRPG